MLATAPPSANAESTALVFNGQQIVGTVPRGESIRLRFAAAEGTEPRVKLSLLGSRITLSIQRSDIIDPDGVTIADTSQFFEQTHRPRKATLKLKGFIAQKTGIYTLLIETNSGTLPPDLVELEARGKFNLRRRRVVKEELTEADPTLTVPLLRTDTVKVISKRLDGGIPRLERYADTNGPRVFELFYPATLTSNGETKSGDRSRRIEAGNDGDHVFEYGYRDGALAGRFQVKIKAKTRKVRSLVPLRLANAPDIPLSVRPVDRSVDVPFGAGMPGIAHDTITNSIMMTAVQAGGGGPEVAGRLFTRDLFPQPGTPDPVSFVGQADMRPGEQIAEHRLVATAGDYYVAWATASGDYAGLARVRVSDLGREAVLEVVSDAASPVVDPFLATNGANVSFGVWNGSNGHDVHLFQPDLTSLGVVPIGGGVNATANTAGAVWNPETSTYDFWAPDSTTFGAASDLHRQTYSDVWALQAPDATPIATIGVTETMPMAVSYDVPSKATVVHWIEPQSASGFGALKRGILDEAGVLVPGSDVTVVPSGRRRPTSLLIEGSIYVASESTGGPLVERYPLLRSDP